MKKSLLAISWAMPPLLFPRSLQISRLFRLLSQRGWDITTLTALPDSVRQGTVIDRDLEAFYDDAYHRLMIASPEQSYVRRALWRAMPFLRPWPDEKLMWAKRIVPVATEWLKTHACSYLVSFAQPWSSHLAGAELHKRTGLPWIAHFSDPWADNAFANASPRSRRRALAWEETILREADRLIFVNDQTAQRFIEHHPGAPKGKIAVVPHGYDTDLLQQLGPEDVPVRKTLRIVHSGNFYGPRTPVVFLKALARAAQRTKLLGHLEVVFLGSMPTPMTQLIKAYGLEGIVQCVGMKPYLESLRLMRTADVLLLIEAATLQESLFFPSKLVDYFCFKKPILGLVSEDSGSAALLRQLKCPRAAPDDIEGIARILCEWVAQRPLSPSPQEWSRVCDPFDIRETAIRFEDVLLGKGDASK